MVLRMVGSPGLPAPHLTLQWRRLDQGQLVRLLRELEAWESAAASDEPSVLPPVRPNERYDVAESFRLLGVTGILSAIVVVTSLVLLRAYGWDIPIGNVVGAALIVPLWLLIMIWIPIASGQASQNRIRKRLDAERQSPPTAA
jgi:hypothetical protein